ncbi:hypothetical protein D3C76_1309830 [compost metagenome]
MAGNQHVHLGCLLNGLNQTKCLVNRCSCSKDAMLRPDDRVVFFHFLSRFAANLIRSRNHPWNNANSIREYNYTLRAHLPEGLGEFCFIQFVDKRHSQYMSGMVVHDNPVVGVQLQTFNMAHEMCRQLTCWVCPRLQSPEHFQLLTILRYT